MGMRRLVIGKREESRIGLLVKRCQKRISGSLDGGFEYHHLAIARSNRFLRSHDSEKMGMFVLFVDLGGSTRMSSELPPRMLTRVIRLFSQEMAYVVEYCGGFVLKYVGDAVIGYFPVRGAASTARSVVFCAQAMMSVIGDAMNPVLQGAGYPRLDAKITVDYGINNIVRYGSDRRKSHIDIIGLSVNLAAKMQSLGRPGLLIVGRNVYLKMPPGMRGCFGRVEAGPREWPYHDLKSRKQYGLFETMLA